MHKIKNFFKRVDFWWHFIVKGKGYFIVKGKACYLDCNGFARFASLSTTVMIRTVYADKLKRVQSNDCTLFVS